MELCASAAAPPPNSAALTPNRREHESSAYGPFAHALPRLRGEVAVLSWRSLRVLGSPRKSLKTKFNWRQIGEVRGAGVRRGKEALMEQLVCRAPRESRGGRSWPVFLGVYRRIPGGAYPDPRRLGPSEPLSHPPGRGPLRPRGARRAGAEGEEARLGK